MNSQALYRRWRPQRFDDIVGQEHVTRTLRNAVRLSRVGHGYLFCGPRGVAKTSTARVLAKAVNCLRATDGEPCNECDLCRAISEGTSYDVIEMDAASNGLVDNVRDLRQHVLTHPDQARLKVYILDEAHRMSAPAFDALLKTLEEPPDHVVFVLVTSEPDKIPATIVSRCQRFDFRRLAQRGIVGRLAEICAAEGVEAEPTALDLIARAATGSMRDAQSILDQLLALGTKHVLLADVEAVLGTAGTAAARDLAAHAIRGEQAEGLRLISRAVADGADPRQFCHDVTGYLRGLLLLKLGGADEALDVSAETLAEMSALAAEANVDQLLRAVKLFGQAEIAWRGTLHFQLPLELAFVEATLAPAPTEATPAPSRPASAPAAPPRPRPAAPIVPPRRDLVVPPSDPPARPAAGAAAQPSMVEPVGSEPAPSAAAEPAPLETPQEAQLPGLAMPTSEPAPVAPDGTGQSVPPGDLRRGWDDVRKAMTSANPRVGSLLAHVRPLSLDGDVLILQARSEPYQRMIVKDLRHIFLELQRVFSGNLRVKWAAPGAWEDDEGGNSIDEPLVRLANDRGWRVRAVIPSPSGEPVQ